MSDPGWSARRLLEISELLTYPTLMGLGGTANYSLSSAGAIEEAARHQYTGRAEFRSVGPEAHLLLDGLSISTPSHLDADLITQFHRDGMSRRLWQALEKLETQVAEVELSAIDQLVDSAVIAEDIVRSTMREVQGVGYQARQSETRRRIQPWTDLTVKLGSTMAITVAAHAPLGLDWVTSA